jgi:hypothetical protein
MNRVQEQHAEKEIKKTFSLTITQEVSKMSRNKYKEGVEGPIQ